MAYKAVIWGTGRSGKALLRAVIDSPWYELAGVWVHSPEKAGKDAGELIGASPTGIIATNDKNEIYRLKADIVFQAIKGHARVEAHDEDVVALLESGKNVVSTRGYLYPWMVSQSYADRFEAACRKGNASLHALGNNPGFVGERLLMAMSGGALRIDSMKITEAYDCSLIDASTYTRMNFGQTMETFNKSSNFGDYEYLYAATFHYIVEAMGGKVERLERFQEVVLADADITERVTVPIRKGTIRAIRHGWTGYVRGAPFLTMELIWWAGPALPGWPQVSGWTNTIAGNPPMKMSFGYDGIPPDQGSKGLIPGILLNSGLEVIKAPPGIVRTPSFAAYHFPKI